MKNEFAPYEEALALKELGFREECFGFYDDILNNNETEHRLFPIRTQTLTDKMLEILTPAPIYQQAFRWFMDEYELYSRVEYNSTFYLFLISDWSKLPIIDYRSDKKDEWETSYKTYEEAQDACLRKLIEIVNQNKDDS